MTALLVGVVLLAANAVFVAAEFASIAARQTSLEARHAAGSRLAGLALDSTRRIQLQLAGAQLGITMASLGLGSVLEPFVDEQLGRAFERLPLLPEGAAHPAAFVLSLFGVVLLHTVLGEMVPKNLAISMPEKTLIALSLPYRAYLWVFRPAIWVLNAAANAGTRLLGVTPASELERPSSPAAIAAIVEASHEEGLIEPFARGLLAGVLELANRHVRDIMTPWADVEKANRDDSAAILEAITAATGHSRVPIVAGRGGPVRSFVHTKDLLGLDAEARQRPVPDRLLRPLLVVAPGDDLAKVLRQMRHGRNHLALVVDHTEETVRRPLGVVSLEDVLEEVVGEIRDESDAPHERD